MWLSLQCGWMQRRQQSFSCLNGETKQKVFVFCVEQKIMSAGVS